MVALFRKDVRLLRPVLLTAVGLAVLFYGLLPTLAFFAEHRRDMERVETRQFLRQHPAMLSDWPFVWQYYARQWARGLQTGTELMWVAGLGLIAATAGAAFAYERRERWADFAAMLPVPRRAAVRGKLTATLAVCLAMIGANLGVNVVASGLGSGWPYVVHNLTRDASPVMWAALAVGLFGVAWLLSALLDSAVLATAVATLATVGTYVTVLRTFVTPSPFWSWCSLPGVLAVTTAGLGVLCTAAGTAVQVRRASP